MIEEFSDLEYDPNFEIKNYKGSYPINQLNKVRRFIIKGFKKDINSKIEFEIKRKCAIFTKDILNYMLADEKPEQFNEQKTFNIDTENNPYVHKILNIDEEDLIISSNENQISEPKISHNISHLPTNSSEQTQDLSPKKGNTSQDDDINFLNKDLLLKHGCDECCFRNLPSKESCVESDKEKEKLVYICDFCQYDCESELTIREHLEKNDHGSASEFWQETKSIDQEASDVSSKTSYDEYFRPANESVKRTIISIKNRCSIKNSVSSLFNNCEIFCPKCKCHFGHKILSACLHFKTVHSPTQTDEVYSIGELIRTSGYEISKVHSCIICNARFKKLSDLANHLNKSGHFPGSRKNEINIFCCPFDNCGLKSTNFFRFKNHIMQHPFFNNPNVDKFCSIEVKVGIYSNPKSYFHLPRNLEKTHLDKKNEIEAIENLIKLDHTEDSANFQMLKEKIKTIFEK